MVSCGWTFPEVHVPETRVCSHTTSTQLGKSGHGPHMLLLTSLQILFSWRTRFLFQLSHFSLQNFFFYGTLVSDPFQIHVWRTTVIVLPSLSICYGSRLSWYFEEYHFFYRMSLIWDLSFMSSTLDTIITLDGNTLIQRIKWDLYISADIKKKKCFAIKYMC